MIEKIKSLAAALAGIGAAILAALFYREKARRLQVERDQVESESEALSRINEAVIESEKQFHEDIKIKPLDRDHFKRPRRLH